MTDFRTAGSIGERIQAARKARGMSARQLAEAIGGVPTQSTIENIELGRKAVIDVVQLLNIAMALKVPVNYLLAPLGAPDSALDLAGLSAEFASMSVIEFDAWLSSVPDGARVPSSLEERNAVTELHALREWKSKLSEIARLEAAVALQRLDDETTAQPYLRTTEERLQGARREADRLVTFLRSAGWSI
jgi:transcriptional regulator with XRE-family HTH domain